MCCSRRGHPNQWHLGNWWLTKWRRGLAQEGSVLRSCSTTPACHPRTVSHLQCNCGRPHSACCNNTLSVLLTTWTCQRRPSKSSMPSSLLCSSTPSSCPTSPCPSWQGQRCSHSSLCLLFRSNSASFLPSTALATCHNFPCSRNFPCNLCACADSTSPAWLMAISLDQRRFPRICKDEDSPFAHGPNTISSW